VIESLTDELIAKSRAILKEVETLGGMAKAIASGMPKLRIEEAAARRQARIDSGQDVIVGVNKYKVVDGAGQNEIPLREVDNTAVLNAQIARLETIKKTRDEKKTKKSLDDLSDAAHTGKNLLAHAIEAMRHRATVGEVSKTLEDVFGRYTATIRLISTVYASHYQGEHLLDPIVKRINEFLKTQGRRPRILVAKLGQDGHDRGAKVVATGLADVGFDVDVGPLFQTPEEVVKQAIENDVHVVGVSSQAGGHKTLIPELRKLLDKAGANDIYIIVGGIVPAHDYEFLKANGVGDIFGPGTPIPECANRILDLIEKKP